jgi:hypothetical protein
MDLTLHRRDDRRPARPRTLPSPAGPVGVLVAAALLSVAFLVAVSDLVTRLG